MRTQPQFVSRQFLLATMVSYNTREWGLFFSKRAHDPLRPNFVCTCIMPIMLINDETGANVSSCVPTFDPPLSLLCAHMIISEGVGTRILKDSSFFHPVCVLICFITVECAGAMIERDHLLHPLPI